MADIRQFFGSKYVALNGNPIITLPFQNTRTGFWFVVKLNPDFNWFEKLEGNYFTQLENVVKCFKDILQREDSKARDYIEANNWTDIFIKCPFHYDTDKFDISQDRPHITAILNGDPLPYHFYSTKSCRAFTNITRIVVENIDWSW
jgi:hypothetical protein